MKMRMVIFGWMLVIFTAAGNRVDACVNWRLQMAARRSRLHCEYFLSPETRQCKKMNLALGRANLFYIAESTLSEVLFSILQCEFVTS